MYMYEAGLKSSWADYYAMVKFDKMWFIFQCSLPCSPYTFSVGVAALGFEALILILKKLLNGRYCMTSSSVWYM